MTSTAEPSRPVPDFRRPDFQQTDRVLHEERLFLPSQEMVDNANITAYIQAKGFQSYDELYAWSIANPEEFWAEQARELHWFKPWDTTFQWTEQAVFQLVRGGQVQHLL